MRSPVQPSSTDRAPGGTPSHPAGGAGALTILHLTHQGGGAGSTVSIAALAAAQQAAGHRVLIGCRPGTVLGERGTRLSGGERQRIAIARALLRDPPILILDEATSALDSESERAIQRSIEALRGRMTIVIVAHRLSTIRGCDRIHVLAEGRIVESGTFDELAARAGSRFRRMCELQELV